MLHVSGLERSIGFYETVGLVLTDTRRDAGHERWLRHLAARKAGSA